MVIINFHLSINTSEQANNLKLDSVALKYLTGTNYSAEKNEIHLSPSSHQCISIVTGNLF